MFSERKSWSSRTHNKVLGLAGLAPLHVGEKCGDVSVVLGAQPGKDPVTIVLARWGSRPLLELSHSTAH